MDKRITRVWHPGTDAPTHYSGKMSECDVSFGKPRLRLSSGEVIEI